MLVVLLGTEFLKLNGIPSDLKTYFISPCHTLSGINIVPLRPQGP
jgi:hypothetical protein